MDTTSQFFSSLQAPSSGCGCGLGAASLDVTSTMDATQAMSRVLARYVELSLQGESLRQLMVKGVQIPCSVWAAYAEARQDYMTKSQLVFDQLTKKDITVEQVIYSGGKPAVDPSNPSRVRTIQVQAPLRPPAFLGIDQQCPGVPMMYGHDLQGTEGWAPIPVELGFLPLALVGGAVAACAAATLGSCLILVGAGAVVLGIAGYAGYKIMQQVAVSVKAYASSPSKIVAAYTACFQSQVASGVSTAIAADRCSGVQKSAQEYAKAVLTSDGWGFWTWAAVGGGVLIAGGLLALYLRNRVSSALGPARMLVPGMAGSRGRKSRRGGTPMLLGDLYLHPRG